MKQGELVKRGFFNNKVVNDQFLEAQREKFKKPQSEFNTEKMLKAIQPRDVVKRKQIKEYLVAKVNECNLAGKKSLAAAYQKWVAQFDVESLEQQINSDFTMDFQKWLLGVGKLEDHQRTPWGRQRVADKECNAYLSVFLDARFEFTNKLQEMLYKAKGLGGLDGIEEYYMFFKYIVRGGWDDQTLFADWLSEWRSWSKIKPDRVPNGDPGLPIEPYLKDETTDRQGFDDIQKAIKKSVTGKGSSLVTAKSSTSEQITKEREIQPNPDPAIAAIGGGQALPAAVIPQPPPPAPPVMQAQAQPQNLPPPPPPPAPITNNITNTTNNTTNNIINTDPITEAIQNLTDAFTASTTATEQRLQTVVGSLQTVVNSLQTNVLPRTVSAPPSSLPPVVQQQTTPTFPPVDTLAAPLATYISTVFQRAISNVQVDLGNNVTIRGVLPEGMKTIYTTISNPYNIVANDIQVGSLNVNVVPQSIQTNDLQVNGLTINPVLGQSTTVNPLVVENQRIGVQAGENVTVDPLTISNQRIGVQGENITIDPIRIDNQRIRTERGQNVTVDPLTIENQSVQTVQGENVKLQDMVVNNQVIQPIAGNVKMGNLKITDMGVKARSRLFNTDRYGPVFNTTVTDNRVQVSATTSTPPETPQPNPSTTTSTPSSASATSDSGQTKLDKFVKVNNKLKANSKIDKKKISSVIQKVADAKLISSSQNSTPELTTASTIDLVSTVADIGNNHPELTSSAIDLVASFNPSLKPLVTVAGDTTLLQNASSTILQSAQATNNVVNNQRIENNALSLNASALQHIASHANTNVPLTHMHDSARDTLNVVNTQRENVLARIPDGATNLRSTIEGQLNTVADLLNTATSSENISDAQGLISTAARIMENVDQQTQAVEADSFENNVVPVAAQLMEDQDHKLSIVRAGLEGDERDRLVAQLPGREILAEAVGIEDALKEEKKEEEKQEKRGRKRRNDVEEEKIQNAVSTFGGEFFKMIAKAKGSRSTNKPTEVAQPSSSSSASMPTPSKRKKTEKGAVVEKKETDERWWIDENQKGSSTPGEKSVNVTFKTGGSSVYQHDSDLEEFQESYFEWYNNREKIEAALKEISDAKHLAQSGNVSTYNELVDKTIKRAQYSLEDIAKKNAASTEVSVEFYRQLAREVVPYITDNNLDEFITSVVKFNLQQYQTSLKNLQTRALTVNQIHNRREKESFVENVIFSADGKFVPTSLHETYLANIETGLQRLVNDLQPSSTSSSSSIKATISPEFLARIKQDVYNSPGNRGTSRMFSLV